MGQATTIEWTQATWNPTTGCTKLSDGCDHCYAFGLAHRLLGKTYRNRLPVVDTPQNREDPFAIRAWPDRLQDPDKWKKPTVIFVNSMSDLFHVDVPEEFVREVFKVMVRVDRHVYQVLTKRPARALRFYRRNIDLFRGAPMPAHIWLGTSVENKRVISRVRQLVRVPAQIRFLSCEPLLGPLRIELDGIGWVIAGGESGHGHRKLDLAWVREIRDQCLEAGVPFFFKQVGGRTPKAGGRDLDGRTWDEMPVRRLAEV